MTTGTAATIPADSFEANDQLLQPAPMGSVADWQATWPFIALSIHSSADRDFYLFSIETLLTSHYWLDLTIDNAELDLDLYLYNSSGDLIRSSVSGYAGEPEALDLGGIEPGDYTLEVTPYDTTSLSRTSLSTYQLMPRLQQNPEPLLPITVALQRLATVIAGVQTTDALVPENTVAPSPLNSRSDGLLDLSNVNRASFALKADLNPEQLATLQQQEPAEPIRFRIALNAAGGSAQALEVQDLIFSVVAVDPTPTPPSANAEPLRLNLLPDADGFFAWPVLDKQQTGEGFVLTDLLIDAIPVADSLQEGTETGSFSIVDLTGAVFPMLSSPEGLNPTHTGQLAVTDSLAPPANPLFNLDVDGDGAVSALGDGLMIIRKLFGDAFAGNALTNKAISPDATRTAEQIHTFIQNGIDSGFLDVDRDGSTTALGDGLMVIRRLFGEAFDGSRLTAKAISSDSPYFGNTSDHQAIAAHIDELVPSNTVGPSV